MDSISDDETVLRALASPCLRSALPLLPALELEALPLEALATEASRSLCQSAVSVTSEVSHVIVEVERVLPRQ